MSLEQITKKGTYIGVIEESGLGLTKNSYPQAVLRLRAEKFFAETPVDIEHFKTEKPDWVVWEGIEQEGIPAYLVLFNNADVFDESTALFHFEDLIRATGWNVKETGDFRSLRDLAGKPILFRVMESEYNGKVSLKVGSVDAVDADPVRALPTVQDEAVLKQLNSKLRFTKKTAATKAPTNPTRAAALSVTAPKTTPPAPTAAKQSSKATKQSVTPPPPADAKGERPTGPTTKLAAWTWLHENKGSNSENEVLDAWKSICGEVGGEKNDEDFTEEDWGKVRDLVARDLSL